jgi:prephenate dehydrogenase
MRLALLGFGLIGGSIARALAARDAGAWTVAAWSPRGDGPAAAAGDGTIARAAGSPGDAIREAELVVLAAPPLACLELLDMVARAGIGDGALVTDVASTKRRIVDRARALGLPFVGGHPMAGREASGYNAADPALFVDRPWVVTPAGDADAGPVEALARAVGARPVRMDPAAHDRAVAAISHLPLVLSVALAEAVASADDGRDDPRALAAGGWASMTRLALGDPEMGAGILATNADEVSTWLRRFRDTLDGWLADLDADAPEADRLRDRLNAARAALESERR